MEWIPLASSAVGLIIGLITLSVTVKKSIKKVVVEEIAVIEKKVDNIEKLINERERARLRQEILVFVGRVRRNNKTYKEDYQRFYKNYDDYKSLNGNHFSDVEKQFVDKIYNEGKVI